MADEKIFSDENLLHQLTSAEYRSGCYKLFFYSKNGLPSAEVTGEVSEFFLYPSGGSLRDAGFNIVWYSARFDTYRGFVPPAAETAAV